MTRLLPSNRRDVFSDLGWTQPPVDPAARARDASHGGAAQPSLDREA